MQTASSAVPASACSEHRANGGVLTQGEKKSKILRGAPRRSSSPFRVIFCILSAFLLAPLTSYAQAKYPFDLPAQSLAESLRAVGHQTSTNVMFEPRLVKGLDAPALRTETTTTEAIRLLLSGTKLTALQTAADTVLIQRTSTSEKSAPTSQAVAPTGTNGYTRLAQADINSSARDARGESRNSERDNSSQGSAEAEKNRIELEEIVVIGTNIRGVYPSSSPVQIYTAEDIARTGATTTEQFIQKLPQNFGARTQYAGPARGAVGAQNYDAVNSVDLRGLGAGTTLTLLNGRRLGLSDNGRSTDISLIPASALARVEVLTDGASAIYGSDAIGGVVNFVLRDDFDGAETRISYGGSSSGDLRQFDASQTFGHRWASGNALVAYNYFDASPLETSDRSYSAPAGPGFLTPDDVRHNVLATIRQGLGERLTVSGDFAFGRRRVGNASSFLSGAPSSHFSSTYSSDTDQYFANLDLDYRIGNLNASLTASYSEVEVDGERVDLRFNAVPSTSSTTAYDTNHSTLDLTGMLDGTLFSLPGGNVRLSIGADLLEEEYFGVSPSLVQSGGTLGRRTTSAFAELFAPLVSETQGVPLVHRLELSLAARYTSYDDNSSPSLNQDFGDATDPKIGLLWAPIPALNLRATYGTSFRAPHLTEIDPTSGFNILSRLAIPFPSGPSAIRLSVISAPASNLAPETAETYTVGFDFRPEAHPGLRISGTYYNIEYTDRIGQAPTGGLIPIRVPDLLPDIIYQAPSAAYVEDLLRTSVNVSNGSGVSLTDLHAASLTFFADPNFWIEDRRYRNLSLSQQDGFDLSVSDRFDTGWGELSAGINVTRILDYRQQGSPNSAVFTVVDTALQPVDLRAHVFLSLSRGAFDGTLGLNYVDDYANRLGPVPASIESWMTVDLNLSYGVAQGTAKFFGGIRLNLSVQNLFDKDPPFLGLGGPSDGIMKPVGFDPANANPLGRFVVLGLSKTW